MGKSLVDGIRECIHKQQWRTAAQLYLSSLGVERRASEAAQVNRVVTTWRIFPHACEEAVGAADDTFLELVGKQVQDDGLLARDFLHHRAGDHLRDACVHAWAALAVRAPEPTVALQHLFRAIGLGFSAGRTASSEVFDRVEAMLSRTSGPLSRELWGALHDALPEAGPWIMAVYHLARWLTGYPRTEMHRRGFSPPACQALGIAIDTRRPERSRGVAVRARVSMVADGCREIVPDLAQSMILSEDFWQGLVRARNYLRSPGPAGYAQWPPGTDLLVRVEPHDANGPRFVIQGSSMSGLFAGLGSLLLRARCPWMFIDGACFVTGELVASEQGIYRLHEAGDLTEKCWAAERTAKSAWVITGTREAKDPVSATPPSGGSGAGGNIHQEMPRGSTPVRVFQRDSVQAATRILTARPRRRLWLMAVAILLLAGVAMGAHAYLDRPVMRIAYASNHGGDWDIHTVNPDGTEDHRIRREVSGELSMSQPQWKVAAVLLS